MLRHTRVVFQLTSHQGMYGYLNTISNGSGEVSSIMYTLMFGAGTAVLAYGCILRVFLRPMKVVSVRRKHCLVTGGSSGIGKEVAKVPDTPCSFIVPFSFHRALGTLKLLIVMFRSPMNLTFCYAYILRTIEQQMMREGAHVTIAARRQDVLDGEFKFCVSERC